MHASHLAHDPIDALQAPIYNSDAQLSLSNELQVQTTARLPKRIKLRLLKQTWVLPGRRTHPKADFEHASLPEVY